MKTPKFKTIKINAYRPGKAEIGRIKNIIKLSANESALWISNKKKKVLSNKDLNISKYPDSKCKNLRKQISKVFKCDFKKIICGSGSDEIIQILCQLYLNPKDEVIVHMNRNNRITFYKKIGDDQVYSKNVYSQEYVNVKNALKKYYPKLKW